MEKGEDVRYPVPQGFGDGQCADCACTVVNEVPPVPPRVKKPSHGQDEGTSAKLIGGE